MDFKRKVKPVKGGIGRSLLLILAIIIIAVGSCIFTLTYLMVKFDVGPAFYGLFLVWAGCVAFFYGVISEEHTLKELFLKQSYFFTGLLAIVSGVFFVALAGISPEVQRIPTLEFGVLIMLGGAALILLSAQKTRDYGKKGAFFSVFSGGLLMMGGLMSGSMNTAYAGVFLVIFGGFWFGMRDRYAI